MRWWLIAAVFAAGAGLFWFEAQRVIDARLDHRFEGDSMLTRAKVIAFPRHNGASVGLVLQTIDDSRLQGTVRVSWHEPEIVPQIGESWQLELRLRRPRGSINPGGFDYETWLFRERIVATGYVVPGHRNVRLAAAAGSVIDETRLRLAQRIATLVNERDVAAVLIAIAIGTRHQLSSEQWQRYATTGTSHLMAISGLHIGLAAVATYYAAMLMLALAAVRGSNHEIAIVIALLVAGAYMFVSGLAVPAQRAFLMLALATLIARRRQQLRGPHVLATTCIFVVLIDPLATLQPGFRMSFAAVAQLLWLARRNRENALRRLVVMQLALLFGLIPLTVTQFGRVALPAPVVNLVAVPVFSVLTVPATLLGVFAGVDGALRIAGWTVAWIEWLIAFVPQSGGATAAIESFAWVYVCTCCLWAILPAGWPGRYCAWLALAALLAWSPAAPPRGCVDATFLDVGQGLAVVLRTHLSTSVYDTGPAWRGGGDAAERFVLPFLVAKGVTSLDRLVISHGDLDHAGGAATLLENMRVHEVLHGDNFLVPGVPSRPCKRGDRWSHDGIEFLMLHPESVGAFEGNDASCVLQVSAGGYRLLITGDIEWSAERALVRSDALRQVDVATVPHHGSRTSSSAPFVERLTARYAGVASGYGNRWGFPKDEVVDRWQRSGTRVLQTAETGAIGMRICSWSGIRDLHFARDDARRLWHEP